MAVGTGRPVGAVKVENAGLLAVRCEMARYGGNS